VSVVRRLIIARGVVPGVGVRPFVYQTAVGLGLGGSVRNGPDGVRIDVEGNLADHGLADPLPRIC
jgi:hydrogenase maturation protein HypF